MALMGGRASFVDGLDTLTTLATALQDPKKFNDHIAEIRAAESRAVAAELAAKAATDAANAATAKMVAERAELDRQKAQFTADAIAQAARGKALDQFKADLDTREAAMTAESARLAKENDLARAALEAAKKDFAASTAATSSALDDRSKKIAAEESDLSGRLLKFNADRAAFDAWFTRLSDAASQRPRVA